MDFPIFGCVKGLFRNSVICAKTWKTFFGVPIEEANAPENCRRGCTQHSHNIIDHGAEKVEL